MIRADIIRLLPPTHNELGFFGPAVGACVETVDFSDDRRVDRYVYEDGQMWIVWLLREKVFAVEIFGNDDVAFAQMSRRMGEIVRESTKGA